MLLRPSAASTNSGIEEFSLSSFLSSCIPRPPLADREFGEDTELRSRCKEVVDIVGLEPAGTDTLVPGVTLGGRSGFVDRKSGWIFSSKVAVCGSETDRHGVANGG